jgi:hypothetical protein
VAKRCACLTRPLNHRKHFVRLACTVSALLDGAAALVWMPGGRLRVVWDFTIGDHRIIAINLVADLERLRTMDLVILEDR